MQTITIQGVQVPRIGLGTWDLRGNRCRKVVREALAMGYRHIDTAEMYRNESQVGQGLAQSGVERGSIFLVSKVWSNHLRHADTIEACEESLRRLNVAYLDLYLIHWPNSSVPVEETLEAMHSLQQAGKIRYLGVSNFSVLQMEAAMRAAKLPIFCNQVPFHAYQPQGALLQRCQEEDIMLTAYSPLAKGRVARDSTLQSIGAKYGKSAPQVALRWLLHHDHVVVIPKASRRDHLQQNLDVLDFALAETDRSKIASLA